MSTRGHLALHSALGATSDISQLINLIVGGEIPCTSASGSCFAIAIENSNWDKVKLLLDYTPTGVNIYTRYDRVTALMKFGHIPDATQYLLRIGADVNAKDRHGDCALSYVIRHKDTNPAAVKMLIDAGANFITRNRGRILNQFLHYHKNIDLQIFTMLLTAGVEVDDDTLSHILSEDQVNLEIVWILIDAPPDANVKHINKNKILVYAAETQNIEVIKLMINAGADVNFQEEYSQYSALMYAVKSPGGLQIFKTLIAAGAGVNFQDKIGCSVLMLAIQCKAEHVVLVVNMLLEKQADIHVKDSYGYNALMFAVQKSDHALELVKALLKSGARVNDRNKDGDSALSLAVREEIEINPQVVEILINAHADVNIQNKVGDTPLMMAVMNFGVTVELVRMFTNAGANVLAENNYKRTVLSEAICSCRWQDKKQVLLIFKHILQLPELKDLVYATHRNHPQLVLLKIVCIYKNILDETLFEIFKVVVNSQFKDTRYLEPVSLHGSLLFENNDIPFGAVALLVNKQVESRHVFVLKNYVKELIDAGFNMQEGVSPLTIFLMNVYCENYKKSCKEVQITQHAEHEAQDAEAHSVSQFIDFLIEHGAHVGQQMLRLRQTYIGLQDLRAQLYLPDALLAALKTGNVRAVRQLLPYWGFPGLYLLLFTSQHGTFELYQLFPVLIEHGGVPQGTELYSKLKQHLALKSRSCPLYLETFEQMHSSPLSLRELCRYQVRASLAAQASHAGHNLPALARELSPPGLKDFLLMQPPADLGQLVCDNLLLVEAASKQTGFSHLGRNNYLTEAMDYESDNDFY